MDDYRGFSRKEKQEARRGLAELDARVAQNVPPENPNPKTGRRAGFFSRPQRLRWHYLPSPMAYGAGRRSVTAARTACPSLVTAASARGA